MTITGKAETNLLYWRKKKQADQTKEDAQTNIAKHFDTEQENLTGSFI